MCITLFGTLGFHPEKFLRAVPVSTGVSKVVIYFAAGETPVKNRKIQRALSQTKRALLKMVTIVQEKKLVDPWNILDMLTVFLEDIEQAGPNDSIFNLTGGTKTMAIAGALACIISGARAIYVPEESPQLQPRELPLPRVSIKSILTPKQIKILELIKNRDYSSLQELADDLRISPSTLSYHISSLKKIGAIIIENGQDSRVALPLISDMGRIQLLLHQRLKVHDGTIASGARKIA